MRKIVFCNKGKIGKGLKKYTIKEFSNKYIENNMKMGKFMICDFEKLSIDKLYLLLSNIYKYRYKIYIYNDERFKYKNHIKYINDNDIIYIDNILEIEDKYNFSKYRKIYHIGDIHGCYKILKKFWDKYYNSKDLFIFLGDIVDRGEESVKTLKFCMEISKYNNVIFIEGNHDTNLWNYAIKNLNDLKISFSNTYKELLKSDIKDEEIRNFTSNFKENIYYKYYDKHVFLSHGGLIRKPNNLAYIDTNMYIMGYGDDYTEVDKLFEDCGELYQIHGHRNIRGYSPDKFIHSQNLEGGIEIGGFLFVSVLSKSGFKFLNIKNNYSNSMLNFLN